VRATLLAGLFLLCLAGCSREPKPTALEIAGEALQKLRSAVVREVRDPQRAKQGAGLIDEIGRLLSEVDADLKAHNDGMRTLNADYDATEAAFRAAFRQFNAKRNARQQRLLDINQRAKSLFTAEEWERLGAVSAEALESAIQAAREG
jgi:hypothetical protein